MTISIKEYIVLHIIVAAITMLTIETVQVLSLPTTQNIAIVLSK